MNYFIQSPRLNQILKWRYINWIKKKVKRNLYLEKIHIVWWTLLYFWLNICNLPNFISKSSSFLWFGCSQRVEWVEDRWGKKPWGTPECCSSGSGVHGRIYCEQPGLTGVCCPGVRLCGSDRCLLLSCGGSSFPRQLVTVCLPCPCPAWRQWLLGRVTCSRSWHSCGCRPSLCLTETILLPTPDLRWWKMSKKCGHTLGLQCDF